MDIPAKCEKCIHHKKTYGNGDVKILDDLENTKSEIDYCDFIEYYTSIGVPIPYPYFYKEEHKCKGHSLKGEKQ